MIRTVLARVPLCVMLASVLLAAATRPANAFIVYCPGYPTPCYEVVVCPWWAAACDGHNQPCCLGGSPVRPPNWSDVEFFTSASNTTTGTPDTLSATVTWCSPSGIAPSTVSGYMTFLVNGVRDTVIVAQSSVGLSGSSATATAVFSSPGTYSVSAAYSGDTLVAGSISLPKTVTVTSATGVDGAKLGFGLSEARPNPSGGGALLTLEIPNSASIHASVYDAAGRQVAVLADGFVRAGRHELSWSGDGASGPMPAGMYFVRVWSPGNQAMRRVTLIR